MGWIPAVWTSRRLEGVICPDGIVTLEVSYSRLTCETSQIRHYISIFCEEPCIILVAHQNSLYITLFLNPASWVPTLHQDRPFYDSAPVFSSLSSIQYHSFPMLLLNKTKVSLYVWNVCKESIMNSIEASMPCSGSVASNCQQTTLETRKNKL